MYFTEYYDDDDDDVVVVERSLSAKPLKWRQHPPIRPLKIATKSPSTAEPIYNDVTYTDILRLNPVRVL